MNVSIVAVPNKDQPMCSAGHAEVKMKLIGVIVPPFMGRKKYATFQCPYCEAASTVPIGEVELIVEGGDE
jgi:hypothetical protein